MPTTPIAMAAASGRYSQASDGTIDWSYESKRKNNESRASALLDEGWKSPRN
jgi:hypothetical protein